MRDVDESVETRRSTPEAILCLIALDNGIQRLTKPGCGNIGLRSPPRASTSNEHNERVKRHTCLVDAVERSKSKEDRKRE